MRVSVSFWLLLLLAAVISPWLAAASVLLGAILHECGHLLMLKLFSVPIEGIRLTALGAVLYARGAERLSYGRELLVTLAGPLCSALFAVIFSFAAFRLNWIDGYVFAGANALLCFYNLLPVPPLDGGKVLYLITAYFFGPMVGDAVSAIVGTVCALALLALGVYLSIISGSGMLFLIAAASLFIGVLPKLRLAKDVVRV